MGVKVPTSVAKALGASRMIRHITVRKKSRFVELDDEDKNILKDGYKAMDVHLNGIALTVGEWHTEVCENNIEFLREVHKNKPITEKKFKKLKDKFLEPTIVFNKPIRKGDIVTVSYQK